MRAASKAAAENAKIVVAQVNERMPRTLGDVFIHVSRVPQDSRMFCAHTGTYPITASEIEERIADFITPLIEDNATLQLGIGGIPDAVLARIEGKQHLGIHTEMISDGLMEAIDKGIITSQKKTLHQGKVVATFVMGTQKLYDYAHNNPLFELHPCDYTNNPFIIAPERKNGGN